MGKVIGFILVLEIKLNWMLLLLFMNILVLVFWDGLVVE